MYHGYSRNLVDRFGSVAVGCFYVTQEYLAGRQLYRSYFSVSFVRFCLALGFVGITMVFMPDLKIIIFVLSVAMLLPSLIVLFYQPYFSTAASNFRDFISLNPTQLTSISRYSFPFVAISLSAALMGLVDRYIIEHFLGLHSVGLYIGAHDLTTQIMAAATSVLVSRFLPPSAMAFETQGVSREFSRIFFRRAVFMLLAIFVLTAMCLIFAPITYLRLLAQEAQEAADAFYIMTILGTGILAVNTILFLIVLMLQKRTMAIFMVSIVSLITRRHLQYVAGALAGELSRSSYFLCFSLWGRLNRCYAGNHRVLEICASCKQYICFPLKR